VWRRRLAQDGAVFNTREKIDLENLQIEKRGKRPTERWAPGKLFMSIYRACDHLEDAADIAWHLRSTVEEQLINRLPSLETTSSDTLVEITLQVLRNYDTTAYVKYASYQPERVSARKLTHALK